MVDETFAIKFQAIVGSVTLFTNCLCSYSKIIQKLKTLAEGCEDYETINMLSEVGRGEKFQTIISCIEKRKEDIEERKNDPNEKVNLELEMILSVNQFFFEALTTVKSIVKQEKEKVVKK